MIVSFKCKHTEELWEKGKSKKLPSTIIKTALRKLVMIDDAEELKDLKVPPNNRLEAWQNDRKSQYSIKINDQWRIGCVWQHGEVESVEITDYH